MVIEKQLNIVKKVKKIVKESKGLRNLLTLFSKGQIILGAIIKLLGVNRWKRCRTIHNKSTRKYTIKQINVV